MTVRFSLEAHVIAKNKSIDVGLPRHHFASVLPSEARVANSNILTWAQRFAQQGVYLFGIRAAQRNLWQNGDGVKFLLRAHKFLRLSCF